jgi:galactose mutarotase-like enzyme
MNRIENEYLRVDVVNTGAELNSLFHKTHQLEYLWGGDPQFWKRKSPVLFPVVGALRDGLFVYDEKEYKLNKHGFAREKEFVLEHRSENEATFLLKSDHESTLSYPFDFELRITYSLQRQALHVTYDVRNAGPHEMFFSIGAHPAFRVPLAEGTAYSDYYLEFEESETAKRHLLNEEGLIVESEDFLRNTNRIQLSKELFDRDALVFKQIHSGMVSLKSEKTERGLSVYFDGFPFLGIWAAKGADFVCIEPWCGVADSVTHSRKIEKKEGIHSLRPGKSFTVVLSVECF